MSSDQNKGLPPHDESANDARRAPPPYPGLGQPEVITQVHVTSARPIMTGGPAVVVAVPSMGRDPATIMCRSCNVLIVTRVDRKSTTKTHLMALLLCVFGCWPCVCIPYCMDSCQSAEHYCPNCNSYLGTYQS